LGWREKVESLRVICSWLKEFVEYEGTPEELARVLTMNGIETVNVERVGGEFEPVLVGEILDVQPHPGADKLNLCRVSTGGGDRRIVCGAPNVAVGQRVPVIPPGARLPDGRTIEAARIRGEDSEGMICSAAELGFADATDGIWVLDTDCEVGAPLSEAVGFSDTVLEVEVTPNRGDCLSVLGIAREVACYQRTPLHPPKPRVLEHGGPVKGFVNVSVDCPDLCPRYTARVVQKIKIGPSPVWMQWRLQTAGIRPINNVVDVTNYVMLERGQPLHAFDLEKIRGGEIVVRAQTAEDESTFTTLDKTRRTPPEGACMICDGAGPVAIGGVIGGLDSEVGPGTSAVLLESALFQPRSVRRTARVMGLATEASFRFERGVNPVGVPQALDRAAELIRRGTGGEVARGMADVSQSALLEKKMVTLRTGQLKRVLGMDIPIREVSDILLALGMEVTAAESKENMSIRIPDHRLDLSREIDIIEEVARIYGYDRFPTILPLGGNARLGLASEWDFLNRVRTVLCGAGLLEAINLSFVPALKDNGTEDSYDGGPSLALLNPLSREGAMLRSCLWPALLRNTAANRNHSVGEIRLFEVGHVFRPGSSPSDSLPDESLHIAGVLSQASERSVWTESGRKRDFYDIKGVVEHLLSAFGVEHARFKPGCGYPYHPSRSATVWLRQASSNEEEMWGELGEIHPDAQRAFDLPQPAMIFEVSSNPLQRAMADTPRFRSLASFPPTGRDLAVVIPAEVMVDSIQRAILEEGAPLAQEAVVFDVHVGDPVPKGRKSVAFALVYRSAERTLTGEEVNEVHARIVSRLSREFQAQLR
jgi:phenylalanyl-tRNA synthetase beta chain